MPHAALSATPIALALAFALSPVHAADPADEPAAPPRKPQQLDAIEVIGKTDPYVVPESSTGTKTPTPLRDTPQSITVVTQQMIRDQAMTNLADVVRFVPGVGMAQGEGNRDTPVLRGNSSTADMFVDGMRDDTQYFRDLYNVERVEALKGPNAMIFGRGGSGGVINRVTKQADGRWVRELQATFGSWNKRRIAADVGDAITDTTSFRVMGMFEDSESFRDDFQARRWGLNPTFSIDAGEDTTISLGYEHFEDDRVADRGIPSEPNAYNGRRTPLDTDPSTFFGDPNRSDATVDVDAINALIEHNVGDDAFLRNRTRLADYDKFYQNVFPGAVDGARTTVAINAYNNGTQRQTFINQTDFIWGASTGSLRHTLLAGVELGRQETDNLRMTGYFGAPGSTETSVRVPLDNPRYVGPLSFRQSNTDANNHGVASSAAAYFQDQIEFSPHWQAIVGVRYDYFSVDFDNARLDVAPTDRNIDSTDNLWSPRAGLVYKPSEPVSIYASYSMSYLPRAGEQLSSLSATNQAFDPEEFTNYELGAKWDIRPTLSLTAAVYQLDRSNVVVPLDARRSRISSILTYGEI